MKCSVCNYNNLDTARFCVECGAPFYKICPQCQGETFITSKFCPSCGNGFNLQSDAISRYKRKLNFFDYLGVVKNTKGTYVLVEKNKKYGIINTDGINQILDCEFDSFSIPHNYYTNGSQNYILLKKNNQWYLYNPLNGNRISYEIFEDCKIEENRKEIKVKINGKWGIICGNTGKFLIPPKYDDIEYKDYWGIRKAKFLGYWGAIKQTDTGFPEITIPFEYKILETFEGEDKPRPSQHRNGKWGVILSYGKKILEFEYDEITYHEPFGHSLYYMRKGSLWGMFFSGCRTGEDKFYPCSYSLEQVKNLRY